MRISESWLREWVSPDLDTAALAHQLTMAGLEVDAIEPAVAAFSGVVVGEVVETRPHPDAEKLTLCQVSNGEQTVPVVCGASNVRAGLKVPFAQVGAILPGDFKIKKAKLRGEESLGMLCGASELGLEDIVDGLLELPADAPVGTDIRGYLSLDDQVIEVDLTPNRADCLSVRGVAREVGALNGLSVCEPDIAAVSAGCADTVAVSLEATDACPVYLGRVIRDVDVSVASPLWLRERLRRAGIGSIDPVVDVTNYVLLELGQPMHAFDLNLLAGEVSVRMAKADEALALLDGQDVTLADDVLVIADEQGAVAMAGVMGGARTAVSAETKDIFLECAWFSPLAIAGKARRYGLHTDSSHRFERGVDTGLQNMAMERATALITAIAGGTAGPVVQSGEAPQREGGAVALAADHVASVLDLVLPGDTVAGYLSGLGMAVETTADGWRVTPPSWRFDIERAEDLIEEVARVHGYHRLPTRLPSVTARPELVEAQLSARRLSAVLVDRGYQEAITYSFVEPGLQAALVPDVEALALANPISADLAVMRTTLWAGLLAAARHNLNRQAERLRLFETGLRFVPGENGLEQRPALAGLVYGSAQPQHWQGKAAAVDFYDVKGDVAGVLALTGRELTVVRTAHPALHPGQCAEFQLNGESVGLLGKIHPAVAAELDISADIFLFELDLEAILQANVPKFAEISSQPRVRRDLAFIVPAAVPAGDVLAAVRRACDERLRDVRIFDVFAGESLGPDVRSLALGLTFQDASRTLVEKDISSYVEAVVSLLKQEFNAHLRD